MSIRLNVTAIMLVGLLKCMVLAQHSDIELFDNAGQVATESHIVEGEFGESPNPAYRANDPGLESNPDELLSHDETPLPGGALVGFDVVAFTLGGLGRGLFYWNGVESPDFATLTPPHELKISDSTETFSTQFDASDPVAGFDFALTAGGGGLDPPGFLHSHLMFDLVDTLGIGATSPAAGIYAFATIFRVSGLDDSEPVYWVLAAGVDEDAHEAAIGYISQSVGIVPEPATLIIAATPLILGMLRRSHR